MAADITAPAADPVAAEIDKIQEVMATDQRRYWHDEGMQSRYRELLAYRDGDGPAPPAPDARSERRREIERILSDEGDRYWKDRAMQREYHALVNADAEATADVTAADGDIGAVRARLGATAPGRALVAEAGDRLGLALEVGEQVRQDILRAIGETAGDVVSAFAGLGDAVQHAVYAELARPVAHVPEAGRDDVTAFAATSHGRALADEWGSQTARKLGTIMARWERMTATLSAAEFREADDFFRRRLSARERAAILRRLAA